MVIFYIKFYLFIYSKQIDPSVIDDIRFFSFAKVSQLPSNLFISVMYNNGKFVFHYSLRVPEVSINLIVSVVDNNDF
jgi:hypothetical protein